MKRSMAMVLAAVCAGTSLFVGGCSENGVTGNAGPAVWHEGGGAGMGRDMLFVDDWKFQLGDQPTAKEAGFDDKGWRVLDLPHDWSVEGAFDPKLASCTAFLPCGIGWYRKSFTMPAGAKNKTILMRFDGVMNHSTVWCNGKQVGERPYGYSSFTCDLTPAIRFGGENVIAVRVDHEQYADSRWYAGSGIYRNVFLSMVDGVHVSMNGTSVTTPQSAIPGDFGIQVSTNVANGVEKNVMVEWRVLDETGAEMAHMKSTGITAYGQSATFSGEATVSHPKLWSPGHPDLYHLETMVKKDGVVVDETSTPFGIRTFAFDPAKGFSINGEGMKLKGVCLHIDAGALGDAVPIAVWEKAFEAAEGGGVQCDSMQPQSASAGVSGFV